MQDKTEMLQTQLDALKATLLAQDFDSLTPEGIQDMLRAFIEDELGLYTGKGGLLQIILAPGAYVFWEGLQALRAQVPISFVDETSGRFIDKDAAAYGIVRKPGTAASVLLTFTGSAGAVIPAGTLCVTQDGRGFSTDEDLTLDEDGRGTVTATADAVGTAYNVPAGAIVSMQQAISGVTGGEVSREGVQRDLLPLVEGSTVSTKYGPVKTDHILFIASGAFHMAKPSDLVPELQGRFPIRVELAALTKDDFVRILTEPKAALTTQYVELLKTEGVELEFGTDAIERLAEIAAQVNERQENIGARRLHTVLERLLDTLSYEAPDKTGKVLIDRTYVDAHLGELVEDPDLSRYIL